MTKEIDKTILMIQNPHITVFKNQNSYSVYLCSEITEPNNYIEVFELFRKIENTEINIYMTSPGGHLITAIIFINLIKELISRNCNVVAHFQGDCYSAIVLIGLACSSIKCYPYLTVMIHLPSINLSEGSTESNISALKHLNSVSKQMYEIYVKPILTPKEYKDVLNGKDVYLTKDQFEEKINNGKK